MSFFGPVRLLVTARREPAGPAAGSVLVCQES
jgi:hypothetical protein